MQAEPEAEEVAAEEQQQPGADQPRLAGHGADLREALRRRHNAVAAHRVDERGHLQAHHERPERRAGQGQFVPRLRRAAPLLHDLVIRPDQAHREQRHDADVHHDGVGHQRPGQQQAHRNRHPPPAPESVQQQPRRQDRHHRADVIGRQQQHLRADTELRRQHQARRDQHPHPALRAGRPALGQQRRERREQGVAQGRPDVHHVGVQPMREFDQHVLGQLGGVEGHIRQPPAVQQQVAVQHVPRLQRVRGPVRVRRDRQRHPQIAGEGHDGGRREQYGPRPPRQPRRGTGPCRARSAAPGRSASGAPSPP